MITQLRKSILLLTLFAVAAMSAAAQDKNNKDKIAGPITNPVMKELAFAGTIFPVLRCSLNTHLYLI